MAEAKNGPNARPVEFASVDFADVWGDALAELERVRPDIQIINLETAITTSDASMPKGSPTGCTQTIRRDLGLMYFTTVEPSSSKVVSLGMVPTRLKRPRVTKAAYQHARWLKQVLDSIGQNWGTWSEMCADWTLELWWARDGRHSC